MMSQKIQVFFSYSHEDETFKDNLAKHLSVLERQGIVFTWDDRKVSPGSEWDTEIKENLNIADIILLLLSPAFLASHYCYEIECKRALERYDAENVCIIPILLKPCEWKHTPLFKLKIVPKDAKPVTDHKPYDNAFAEITTEIRDAASRIQRQRNPLFFGSSTQAESRDSSSLLLILLIGGILGALGFGASRIFQGNQITEPTLSTQTQHRFQIIDENIKTLMLKTAGREAQGILTPRDIATFSCSELERIDKGWLENSNGRFGLNIQWKIYQEKLQKDGNQLNDQAYLAANKAFTNEVGWTLNGENLSEREDFYGENKPLGQLPRKLWTVLPEEDLSLLFKRIQACGM